MKRSLDVVQIAMETSPVAKVGGLGDVVDGLSRVLATRGHRVTIVLPQFGFLAGGSRALVPVAEWEGLEGRQRLHHLEVPDHPARLLVLEDPRFTERDGIYVDPETREEYPDALERYGAFSLGVLELLARMGTAPDILHVHDNHTALIPSLIRRAGVGDGFFASTGTVLTIHNAGYQGIYDLAGLAGLGLDEGLFESGGPLEFRGRVNLLKAGIVDADVVTTVSPEYAREITNDQEFGCGLETVIRARNDGVLGILNGIDTRVWNSAHDRHLVTPYDSDDLRGKLENKRALLVRTGSDMNLERPVVGMVSRLTRQKGVDLVLEAFESILTRGVSLVVLGSGNPRFEEAFSSLGRSHRGRFYYSSGFDDGLAHLIQGGADIFLMPSRYEPCGLTQMIAMGYGTVPVVRRVGGVVDTVRPADDPESSGTGFLFEPYRADALLEALDRALTALRDRPRWEAIMRQGMSEDFSWQRAVDKYETVFMRAVSI
jgi:starch synthase